ncbi:NahK/ErcS family hybrid sensor histidine kinase/response regulator [Halopseudomonas pelagia]|uniref:histidine kinase n=1 Tax=Halopseudomonas pelagia TaxID=553151 RepID=A0AA91U030_9GAMM|nr:NahK/ErcS family hybrid sensor histidine kinase/response regulator [Halopseudomonas pelagia]PCC98228.1 hybrid sensor histidine kinase/response regulator [Halopseudomonas pelagia]QFY57135.1 response regulator [Halopseudomonas pelagia]
MQKPSDPRREVLTGLLGLGSQSSRKSYYPELLARLEELEAERNRYKWLFENALHGIFQAGLGQGFVSVNRALARMLAYTDAQALLSTHEGSWAGILVGGEKEFQAIRRTLMSQDELAGYETQLMRADGQYLQVRINMLLRPDVEGPVVEAFVADVTERKNAQAAMQRLNDDLERRVQARTQELEALNDNLRHEIIEREKVQRALRDARDAAEQANRSKDRYLAAASHDLLQPMNAARLLMSTLRERTLPMPEAQLVDRSHSALESAEDMLTDLLDIARLDQSTVKPELGDYNLAELIEPLVAEFRGLAEASGIELRMHLGPWAVNTDYRLLSRILRNLLSNAIRYTDQGAVLIGARRRGEVLDIQVWDTGRGIPAAQFGAIFKEFNQLAAAADAPQTNKQGQRKGVGLGLAIVERIAALLSVHVAVHSRVGRGSMFSVSVPMAKHLPAAAFPSTGILERLAEPLQGRRLLVIDNEQIILASMRDLLTQWGADVCVAVDADSALMQLDGVVPDVILVDYHLDGGRNGCEAVSQLRERWRQGVPAIMITADRSEHCQQTLRELGIPVLNKPLKASKLRAMLGQMLRG